LKCITLSARGFRPWLLTAAPPGLSSAANATIVDGQAVGTILDNEPRISISDVAMKEGKKGQTTLFTFTVTLSAAYDQAVTMLFRTVYGTAKTSDKDYIAKTGTLTFAPGETTKTITPPSPPFQRGGRGGRRATAKRRPMRRSTSTCSATAAIRCSPRIVVWARF